MVPLSKGDALANWVFHMSHRPCRSYESRADPFLPTLATQATSVPPYRKKVQSQACLLPYHAYPGRTGAEDTTGGLTYDITVDKEESSHDDVTQHQPSHACITPALELPDTPTPQRNICVTLAIGRSCITSLVFLLRRLASSCHCFTYVIGLET